jgi:preprotein translocase subunit SecG
MTTGAIIEIAFAAALIVGAVVLYRRRGAEGEAKTGSQSAVILLMIGLILLIHGSGLLEYRPAGTSL